MLRKYRRELGLGLAGLAIATRIWNRKSRGTQAVLASSVLGAGFLLMPTRLKAYRGKTVVITGGSRGLGFAFAENLIAVGANVALIARDAEELERAHAALQGGPGHVFTISCDITDCEHLDTAFAEARARFGRIDVLINNAGAITVAPFATLKNQDIKSQIDLHLNATIHAMRLIRPYFHQNGGGHIINISSVGGVIPVPFLSAYSASKFAIGGFSESVAPELAMENIQLLTAYPGLMRTGSPIQAQFKGEAEQEYELFAMLDNAPLTSISADRAAKRILRASLEGRRHVVISAPAKLGRLAHALFPELTHAILDLVTRALPQASSGATAVKGAALRGEGVEPPFSSRQRAAEAAYNQQPI